MKTHREFYDRISRAYDLISDASEREAREAGERALAPAAGERVLEVGCGTGNSLLHFAEAVGPSGSVHGFDVSEGMLAVSAAKLDESGRLDRACLCCGDASHLPYRPGVFDAAFFSFTLELFELTQIPRVLAEVRRTLVPGGRVAVVAMALPDSDERESLLERGYRWMHRHFPHIVDCAPIEAAPLFEAAGFDVCEHRKLSMWTMPVSVLSGRART